MFYDIVQVISSVDSQLGMPERLGSVEWTEHGLRMIGCDTASVYVGSDGKPALGSAIVTTELARHQDDMIYSSTSQAYELRKTPAGQLLQIPDLEKPFGKPFSQQTKANSLFNGHE
jgi:hypothetical protein